MRKVVFLIVFLSIYTLRAQELKAVVTINAEKVQGTNKQVYTTLQKALTEFINQTQWTDKNIKPQEKINCSFAIIINKQSANYFEGSLQVQSTRPVYGSTYETPILNINDTDFNFKYNEFDPLLYNPTKYDSNLVSTLVFYIYTILGVDADTFAPKGGEGYLRMAENAMLQAQQSGLSAWRNEVGKQNRFALIDNLLSSKYTALRNIYYNYHRKGLDVFYKNTDKAKQEIEKDVIELQKMFNITVGNYMIRGFLDAKSDEIVSIFSDGKPTKNQQKMVSVLQKVSPVNRDKWRKIN
ncbi:DUF4835 family protein [Tenacibaculum sp. UWU-22]|uniref:type IX secretion system protein PorD n=1 Tax=Tenacibaculum sp. UWU-22 TaxID=3234187 RepID=UPI0034DB5479